MNWPGPEPAADQCYDFACFYAVAWAGLADRKQVYADRAMALLRQAAAGGYKDAAHLKKDADLDALRDRDDFKSLLKELGAVSAGRESTGN